MVVRRRSRRAPAARPDQRARRGGSRPGHRTRVRCRAWVARRTSARTPAPPTPAARPAVRGERAAVRGERAAVRGERAAVAGRAARRSQRLPKAARQGRPAGTARAAGRRRWREHRPVLPARRAAPRGGSRECRTPSRRPGSGAAEAAPRPAPVGAASRAEAQPGRPVPAGSTADSPAARTAGPVRRIRDCRPSCAPPRGRIVPTYRSRARRHEKARPAWPVGP